MTARAEAELMDATDALAHFRDRFTIADPERIYLDGNSLGRPGRATEAAIAAGVDTWRVRGVEAWADWIELPRRVGDRLAAVCLGARPGEVVACDSVTVNLYKLAHAALDHRDHGPVVVLASEFPTDRYVLEGVARARGRDFIRAPSLSEAFAQRDAALICLSLVDYRTGELRDLAVGSDTSALVIWDVSHAVGAVEIGLSRADLAVGCTYKYLGAGPGAPAFLYVRSELQEHLRTPIQGWFGQHDQFAMGSSYEPAEGTERFLAGTPAILGLLALDASLDLFEEAGMASVAQKSQALTEFAVRLSASWLAPLGFQLASPLRAEERGGHIALVHRDAWRIARALIERGAVIPDFRRPDILRLGMPAMYTRFVDVWDGLARLRTLVTTGEHLGVDDAPRRVT